MESEANKLDGGMETPSLPPDPRHIWSSMFTPDAFNDVSDKNKDILGILMLLLTAVESVKKLGSRYENLTVSFKSSILELEQSKFLCTELKENLKSAQEMPCFKCSTLKNQLKEANKRAEEAQTRMNSIARILSLGNDKEGEGGSRADIVSQILMGASPKNKRKKTTEEEAVEGDITPKTLPDAQYLPHLSCNSTIFLKTPPKMKKRKTELNKGEWEEGEEKALSGAEHKESSPRMNHCAGLGKAEETPTKRIEFQLEVPTDLPGVERNYKSKLWKLKERRGVTSRERGKKLKQMTLGVEIKPNKKDITIRKQGRESSSEEDVDIVLPSPRKTKGSKKKPDKRNVIDLSLFAPLATSTQVPKQNLDNSFDRPSPKKKNEPNYKYKREAVKNREERAKLEGRNCEECQEYFEVAGRELTSENLQRRINLCSRHKEHYVRPKSPPGFWDPVMPDTQECRENRLYTSVYQVKEKK